MVHQQICFTLAATFVFVCVLEVAGNGLAGNGTVKQPVQCQLLQPVTTNPVAQSLATFFDLIARQSNAVVIGMQSHLGRELLKLRHPIADGGYICFACAYRKKISPRQRDARCLVQCSLKHPHALKASARTDTMGKNL